MRLIHTSDWHLGRTLHGADLLGYQREFCDWLLALAVSRRAGAVVVAGDVYDRAVPGTDAVALLDHALTGFARAGIPVLLISGNHDSAVRLGFGSGLSEAAGIHLRTRVADIGRPLLINDDFGPVALYGIPYLLPDAAAGELGAGRSHESVLTAAAQLIRADAAARGATRTVVAAHAFVTGAQPSESERDIRVGGVADAPAAVFDGFSYVALGHLHGPQRVTAGRADIRYSGSPLAFSFGEKDHVKSVTVADIDAAGQVSAELVPVPVPRPLREVRGRLDDLLAAAGGGLAGLADCWVKAVLTDRERPPGPMERLREKWPHTLVLDFAPEGGMTGAAADLARLAAQTDPVEICGLFVEYAGGAPPDDAQRAVLADVVETVSHAGAGA